MGAALKSSLFYGFHLGLFFVPDRRGQPGGEQGQEEKEQLQAGLGRFRLKIRENFFMERVVQS